jgi:hypothetical protein
MNQQHPFTEQLQQLANEWESQDVPNWDRERTFRPSQQPRLSWWQRPWLPLASLVSSAFAVVLVLGNTQIISNEHGVMLRFGSTATDTGAIEQLVAQRLNEYAAAQQLALVSYGVTLRNDMREDMNIANQQLVNYVIAANREERNVDMADLIRYVNAQREDDQVFFANQIQQLSEDLLQQSGYPLYLPVSQ